MKKYMNGKNCVVGIGICLIALIASASPARAADGDTKTWSVPIVMEKATIRGKVAVLETKREDRKVVEGLKVEVWSTKKIEQPRHFLPDKTEIVRDELLHETETDPSGLFSLPILDTGEFLLVVGEVTFRLAVVEQAENRAGQDEPKVLLILVPKEVISV